MTNTITLIATLVTNLVTNWTDTGIRMTTLIWPPEANTTSSEERGTVHEIVSLQIQYDGKQHMIEVSRKLLAVGTRKTWNESVKQTGHEQWGSWEGPQNITFGTTNVLTIQ